MERWNSWASGSRKQAAHLDAATHRLLTDLRNFDARGGWHAQGAMSCAHWLAWRVGWDLVTSRERVRVAGKLGEFTVIDDALRRGEVSYSKVRAMVRVATPANETLLLEYVRLMTASQLDKLCRKYALVRAHDKDPRPRDDEQRRYVRRRETCDGLVKIEAVLHPEEAEMVWAMLDHAAKKLCGEPQGMVVRGGRCVGDGRGSGPGGGEPGARFRGISSGMRAAGSDRRRAEPRFRGIARCDRRAVRVDTRRGGRFHGATRRYLGAECHQPRAGLVVRANVVLLRRLRGSAGSDDHGERRTDPRGRGSPPGTCAAGWWRPGRPGACGGVSPGRPTEVMR
jgi:hypothetical protein